MILKLGIVLYTIYKYFNNLIILIYILKNN